MSTTMLPTRAKTCFIASPAGAPLQELRDSLRGHGVELLQPDLVFGTDLVSQIRKQISQADLVVGILTSERTSPWVLFELGHASAFGRRILLIATPGSEQIPFALHQMFTLRIDLSNREAIDFALDQVLDAPPSHGQTDRAATQHIRGLGSEADRLLADFAGSLAERDWPRIEQIVAEAIRLSGAELVVASNSPDKGADLAVWSDLLEPLVGNPLLIEIKSTIKSEDAAQRALRQVSTYIAASGSPWAVLVYLEGPRSADAKWFKTPPNIITYRLDELIEALRQTPFPELIRELRNRRVHGVR